VLVIFSQRNSPASEPGQRVFSVSPGTAGNRIDRWLSECLPTVSRARIQAHFSVGRDIQPRDNAPALAEIGITKDQSARAKKFAAVSADIFREINHRDPLRESTVSLTKSL
jgi:hypothetical protein